MTPTGGDPSLALVVLQLAMAAAAACTTCAESEWRVKCEPSTKQWHLLTGVAAHPWARYCNLYAFSMCEKQLNGF
ncbi:hypothetical protein EVAR_32690_1 [Eumeta japonica]|uniref:Secreted protein n=1 Tax=Eumeta variegata TaxID=151549 RepID=A0A4C1VQM0_EUMVA|nr:hypothetical protein EVAR_32690_1 [Eumeta japonica]